MIRSESLVDERPVNGNLQTGISRLAIFGDPIALKLPTSKNA